MNSANKIDAKEVLTYLNQLGYTNISAQILKDFLTDLKRLMKSFSQEKDYNCNSAFTDYISIRSTLRTRVDSDSYRARNNIEQSCERLENNPVVDKKLRQISLHLLRNVNKKSHDHCIHVSEPLKTDTSSNDKENKLAGDSLIGKSSKTTVPISKTSLKSKSIATQSSGRDKAIKVVNRRDPVALYHYYQTEWKKVKFPGEEEHATLRRMIRQKLHDDEIVKKYNK